MAIEFAVLEKKDVRSLESFQSANEIAEKLRLYLEEEEMQRQICKLNVLGASSALIQALLLDKATALGFKDEKRGLFKDSALRPDYFCKVADSGILLEVERGKTITNNMDLLDFWKCHICDHADYLFLLVPQVRPNAKGTVLRPFEQVKKRLRVFFEPKNYVNVNAVHLFGY